MPCHTKFTHGVSCRAKSYEKFFFLQTFCPYASGFCAGFVDNPFKKTYNIILEYFSRKHPKCGTEAAYLTCIIFRRGERTALPCKEVMEEKNMKKASPKESKRRDSFLAFCSFLHYFLQKAFEVSAKSEKSGKITKRRSAACRSGTLSGSRRQS